MSTELPQYRHVTGNMDALRNLNFIYLAGPFFNRKQIMVQQRIEQAYEEAGVNAFSPRLQHRNDNKSIQDPVYARKVFEENADALSNCRGVLAVVDYLLPEEQTLRVLGRAIGQAAFESASPSLSLPDSGTVWEMGFAYSQGIPVQMFTTKPIGEGRINIMLSQGCNGVIYGWDHLDAWLEGKEAPKDWKGGSI